ncbi:hypothetical protein JCM11251_000650 [Rhodosporidiobolus azoricus]
MAPPPTASDQLENYKAKAMEDFAQAVRFLCPQRSVLLEADTISPTSDNVEQQSYLNDKRQDIQSLYVDPAISFFASSAERAPIATTFFTLLATLSAIPVATFLFFATGTILVIGGGALLVASILIGWLVGAAALLLVGALAVTTFISVFATVSLLAGYAVLRFISIVASSETLPDAIKQAQEEATNLYAGRAWQLKEQTDAALGNGSGNKKVRIDGVVKQEGQNNVPVKRSDGNSQS